MMKVHVISENENLIKLLEERKQFQVSQADRINGNEDAEIVIVSENLISFEILVSTKEMCMANKNQNRRRNKQKVFFLYVDEYDVDSLKNMVTIGKLHGIELLSAQQSEVDIIAIILESYPSALQEIENVITFFGADNKVGTTMIAHSVAEMMAMHTDLSIGLLCLNNNPSREYLKSNINTGIDNIKIKLFNNVLNADELVQVCVKENDALYILPGVDYSPDARLFMPEHITRLINMASKKFDIVLIDAGSNIDSGLAIASLKLAKARYLIITQQEVVRKNFKRIENQVLQSLGLDIKKFMLIVNKYIGSDFMYNSQQLSNMYGAILATVIPHADFFGWKAEIEEQTLLHYGLRSYNNQIDYLCKIISLQNQIVYQTETRDNIIRRAINSLGGM